MNEIKLVSVCVIALNEEEFIKEIIEDILNQNYDKTRMELILVDSMSTDGTKKIMESFLMDEQAIQRIVILENPCKIIAAGWNIAIREAKGDVVIKIDAHARIPEDFVRKNVNCLESGEYVSGGMRPCLPQTDDPWSKTLLIAENSIFGSSISDFRRGSKGGRKYVKSLFHPAYRAEIFEKVGFFDEQLLRTEDNEINYRIRKAGYKMCFDSEICSYQYARNTLKNMIKQKYSNGYWIALTLKVCPMCLSVYHFAPFMFVIGMIITTCLAMGGIWQPAAGMWSLYWMLAIIMAYIGGTREGRSYIQLLIPLIFFLLHSSYGIGTIIGMVKLPFWKYKKHGR